MTAAVLDSPTVVAAPPRRSLIFAATGFFVLMIAGGAPSPLYSIYQKEIGFSAGTLTVIFAIYAIALLVALMIIGSLSDYIGRRPVLVAALLLEAVSMALFLPAHSVWMLLIARSVQGVATGAGVATFSAALIDTARPGTKVAAIVNSTFPSFGLGVGALAAGAAIKWSDRPADTVFLVLAIAFVLLAGLALLLPETGPVRPGALGALRPTIAVPPNVRGPLILFTPTLIAIWAVGGLFLSLGASLGTVVFGLSGPFGGASVIAAMTFSGSIAVLILRARPASVATGAGSTGLILGPALLLLALATTSTPVFLVGVVITGVGFGGTFFGVIQTIGALVEPAQRAGVFAIVFTINYLAFSLPAVGAGVASQHFGLRGTVEVYAVLVMLLTLATLVALRVRSRAPALDPA
ncbi:MAG: major facilitator superfamily 1 [Pseudonocardiales bacterium]|nr:major facilitator superfamily 1 [Jatrophihabitantaceae bacterium]MCW2602691.1 major facilitator superfamily 1 [Pseudonocardiales bacterium]